MNEFVKDSTTNIVKKNLIRFTISSIPLLGNFLSSVIIQTKEDINIEKERSNMLSSLERIKKDVQNVEFDIVNVFERLIKTENLSTFVLKKVSELHNLLEDPTYISISEEVDMAISKMIIHNLPFPSIKGLFKGRQESIDKLIINLRLGQRVTITQTQTIHGLGGIGKTRLSIEFAWNMIEMGLCTAAFFIPANNVVSLRSNLASIASPKLLNLSKTNALDQDTTISKVLKKLSGLSDWVIIFDNVDDSDAQQAVRKLIPNLYPGKIIITSRRANWPDGFVDVRLDRLDNLSGSEYLIEKTEEKRRKTKDDIKHAITINEILDGLPIALEQASAYICYTRIGLKDYISAINEAKSYILSWHNPALINYPKAVSTVWQVTEKYLRPSHKAILNLLSFVSSEKIPTYLFELSPMKIKRATALLEKSTENEDPQQNNGAKVINAAIEALSKLLGSVEHMNVDTTEKQKIRSYLADLASWSMIDIRDNYIYIHRLVQDVTRLSIPDHKKKDWIAIVLDIFGDFVLTYSMPDKKYFDFWAEINTHLLSTVFYAERCSLLDPTYKFIGDTSMYFYRLGEYQKAEELVSLSMNMAEKSGPIKDDFHAKMLMTLGGIAHSQQRYEFAEKCFSKALRIAKNKYGDKHDLTIEITNNLAVVFKDTKRYNEAEKLFKVILDFFNTKDVRTKGVNQNTIMVLYNYASLLSYLNRFSESEKMYLKAIEICEKEFAEEHHYLSICTDGIANLYYSQGKFEVSEKYYKRSIEISKKIAGPKSINAANSMYNYAILLNNIGNISMASEYAKLAHQIFLDKLGYDHPNTMKTIKLLKGFIRV